MALTDIKIKSLKPLEKKYKIYDRDGLYLLVCPNGSKYFRYNFKFKKKSKTYAIGVYPNTSLQEAREILVEVKKMLSNGINPNDNKKIIQTTHSNNSFYEISLEWKELFVYTPAILGMAIFFYEAILKTYVDFNKIETVAVIISTEKEEV